MRRISVVGLLVAALSSSGASLAQGSPSRAEELFRAGRDAMKAGDHERACENFRESHALDPQPGTKMNLGACEEKRGHLVAALELFRAVESALPASDPRVAIAKERISAIAPKVPEITFKLAAGAPESTVVKVTTAGGVEAKLGVALPLDPGEHQVTVSAPGYSDRTLAIELAEAERKDVEVSPGARTGGTEVGADTEAATSSGSNKTLGYVLGGVGVAGVVVGAVAGVMVLNKKSIEDEECDHNLQICSAEGADAQDAGRTLGVVSTVGFVVGAIGLGAGAYFLLSSDDSGRETGLAVRSRPSGAFVSLEQTW